jgi:hypothetical protein
VRKLAERVKRDPATLDEAEVRAHLLRLKMSTWWADSAELWTDGGTTDAYTYPSESFRIAR